MITVSFNFPAEMARNSRVRSAIRDAGEFIRDLWLARAPYATGEYARGLLHQGAIKISGNKLEITNKAKHAQVVEFGLRSYNLGLAMLLKGRGVKFNAEGMRYKVIKIDQGPTSKYRQPSVGQAVQKSYAKLAPIGLSLKPSTRFGSLQRYNPRKSLRKTLSGGKKRPGPDGVFVISEKAIRENPQKWMMPAREGKYLARNIQKEGAQIIKQVLGKVVLQEKERALRTTGKVPGWYKASMSRSPMKQNPVRRGRP